MFFTRNNEVSEVVFVDGLPSPSTWFVKKGNAHCIDWFNYRHISFQHRNGILK